MVARNQCYVLEATEKLDSFINTRARGLRSVFDAAMLRNMSVGLK